jgi:hypothetical protein
MSNFLENLKQGMQDAHKKFASAQQKFNITQAEFHAIQQRLTKDQAEFQGALQEFQAFQTLVNVQTRKEQPTDGTPPEPAVAAARPHIAPLPSQTVTIHRPPRTVGVAVTQLAASQSGIDDNKSESNKTEAVRMLLRQHTSGMTPGEIWKNLQSQVSNRVYLYSVLKRLKDRGDVRVKRGKYYFNLKPEENESQITVQ